MIKYKQLLRDLFDSFVIIFGIVTVLNTPRTFSYYIIMVIIFSVIDIIVGIYTVKHKLKSEDISNYNTICDTKDVKVLAKTPLQIDCNIFPKLFKKYTIIITSSDSKRVSVDELKRIVIIPMKILLENKVDEHYYAIMGLYERIIIATTMIIVPFLTLYMIWNGFNKVYSALFGFVLYFVALRILRKLNIITK